MSVETPSDQEFKWRMNAQKRVAAEMLGFNVEDPQEQTPGQVKRFMGWIIENGLYFKNILEKNPDIWQRVTEGAVRSEDIHWIKAQLRDDYDTGAEEHGDERDPDELI